MLCTVFSLPVDSFNCFSINSLTCWASVRFSSDVIHLAFKSLRQRKKLLKTLESYISCEPEKIASAWFIIFVLIVKAFMWRMIEIQQNNLIGSIHTTCKQFHFGNAKEQTNSFKNATNNNNCDNHGKYYPEYWVQATGHTYGLAFLSIQSFTSIQKQNQQREKASENFLNDWVNFVKLISLLFIFWKKRV